jgi:hypothetical protein
MISFKRVVLGLASAICQEMALEWENIDADVAQLVERELPKLA